MNYHGNGCDRCCGCAHHGISGQDGTPVEDRGDRGVSFSSEHRRIEEWRIEELQT